jgi:hypothetical protein
MSGGFPRRRERKQKLSFSLTAAPPLTRLACAGAAHKRRRPVGLAKPGGFGSFTHAESQGKKLGAKHRKRDRAPPPAGFPAVIGRPRGA